MEYCPEGTLEDKCKENIEMPCVRRYTYFLLKAVEYIHERMILHRDIKPANIFMGRNHVLKLGDFGSSVHLRGGSTAFGEIVQLAGTPAYMAPEVQTLGGKVDVNGKEEIYGYGRAADIWSLGCVVLEMCTGKVALISEYPIALILGVSFVVGKILPKLNRVYFLFIFSSNISINFGKQTG